MAHSLSFATGSEKPLVLVASASGVKRHGFNLTANPI
jgi:hypothetical protein